jgi:hypothetical protein
MDRFTAQQRDCCSQYGFEGEAHWGWDEVGPGGSWRNWNPDPSRWRPIIKEREPLHP